MPDSPVVQFVAIEGAALQIRVVTSLQRFQNRSLPSDSTGHQFASLKNPEPLRRRIRIDVIRKQGQSGLTPTKQVFM